MERLNIWLKQTQLPLTREEEDFLNQNNGDILLLLIKLDYLGNIYLLGGRAVNVLDF